MATELKLTVRAEEETVQPTQTITIAAREKLVLLGLNQDQIDLLTTGESVAFVVASAPRGTVGVARLNQNRVFQCGMYTINNPQGGTLANLTALSIFENASIAAAVELDAVAIQLIGFELNNDGLEKALRTGGFNEDVTIPAPLDLDGGEICGIGRTTPLCKQDVATHVVVPTIEQVSSRRIIRKKTDTQGDPI